MTCAAFWWGNGGGMEIVVGFFPVGSVGGGSPNVSNVVIWLCVSLKLHMKTF